MRIINEQGFTPAAAFEDIPAFIDAHVSWDDWSYWESSVPQSTLGHPDIHVVDAGTEFCDHETCYETHDIKVILEVNGRYFRKSGEYNSQDGMTFSGPPAEVYSKTAQVLTYVTAWEAQR